MKPIFTKIIVINDEEDNMAVKQQEDLSKWPWATMLAVLATLALGLVSLVDNKALNLDDYMTQVVVIWGAIGVGRGLAAKTDPSYAVLYGPITRFVNTFNWATVVAGIVVVVGYVSVLTGDTVMSWSEYGIKAGALIGALGLGRGIATLKKDGMLSAIGGGVGAPLDPGREITDEDNIREFGTTAPLDEGLGATTEPPKRG